jgi:tetratricopeptide (TPR) repeat protein
MIVKNEEDWIEGALDSVKGAVDEIILGDTGCTDRTLELAQRFSPKVLTFQWPEDFAEARNRTLAEARHPWILVLDADERIAGQDLPILRDAMQQGKDGFHLIQRNYVLGNQVFGWTPNDGKYAEGAGHAGYVDNPLIRFFRNDPELRFRGAVHEIIDPTRLPARFSFGSTSLVLHHYGKVRGEERLAAKQRHYLVLGQKKVQQEPGNAKAHFDLGIQHQELNDHAKAAACFQQAFALNKTPAALLYGAISEKHQGRLAEALTLLDRALDSGFNTFDVHLERGNTLLALGRTQDALGEYAIAQQLNPKNPIAAFNAGLSLRKLNDLNAAAAQYGKALQLDPSFDKAALELATLHGTTGKHMKAAELLEPLVARRPEFREARLTLAKTLIALNRAVEAVNLLTGFAGGDDAVARSLLGAAHLQHGDLGQAEQHLDYAVRKDRSLVDARINLATIYARRGDTGKAERFRMAAAAVLRQTPGTESRETRPEA